MRRISIAFSRPPVDDGDCMDEYKPVPALEKAFAILDFLADHPEKSFSVTEITKATGYNKSTLFFILRTLQEHEFVDKSLFDGKYSLGGGLGKYVDAYFNGIADLKGFTEVAKKISNVCHECINLSVLKGMYNYVVESIPAQDISLRVDLPIGSKIPVIVSSAGKVLICSLNDEEISKIYDALHQNYTDNTIRSKDEFLEEIHEIRRNGYAINEGEYESGVCSAGAPIFNASGKVIAAINIVLPASRFVGEKRSAIINFVKTGAAELSSNNKAHEI